MTPTALTADDRWLLDSIIHRRPFRSDEARLEAVATAVEEMIKDRIPSIDFVAATLREAFCDCEGYGLDDDQHAFPDGCHGLVVAAALRKAMS